MDLTVESGISKLRLRNLNSVPCLAVKKIAAFSNPRQKYNKKTIDLSNPNVRSEIRSLFLWLSHSPANLFHGNGGVNQAIGNCFDYSELYGNIEDLDKIYNFWNTLFTDLNFQPQEVNKIYCILLDKYIPASYLWDNHHCKFFQHKLTRSIKGAKGIIE